MLLVSDNYNNWFAMLVARAVVASCIQPTEPLQYFFRLYSSQHINQICIRDPHSDTLTAYYAVVPCNESYGTYIHMQLQNV